MNRFFNLVLFKFLLLLTLTSVSANDSSYYARGNQIIPLQETDISVKKEILTIKRIEDDNIRITVDYTFHNPGKEKSLLMGFEAGSPYGDVDGAPRKLQHPYIDNFSVTFNKKNIPHNVAILPPPSDDNQKPQTLFTLEELKKNQIVPKNVDPNFPNLRYVYHFPATFPNGETQVVHSYQYKMSSAVFTSGSVDYLLTPALRWANKQIDDFTLIIDLGEFQQYHIAPTFFDDIDSWTTTGRVKFAMENVTNAMSGEASRMLTVWQHRGSISFHAKNFQPKGELSLFANRFIMTDEILDSKKLTLSLQEYPWFNDDLILKNEFTRKVLENYPYARHGYVFKNKELKAFYDNQPWYMPDPDYNETTITKDEQEWLDKIRKLKVAE